MTELFRMNEYGDIWQEPMLWDQVNADGSRACECQPDTGWTCPTCRADARRDA